MSVPIDVEHHLSRVRALADPLPAVEVPVTAAAGRVLATDVTARLAVPAFDNSAMDGFAVRSADLSVGVGLRVIGDVPAGAASLPQIAPGEAARIMTGAPLPPGADCVVQVELTDQPVGDAPLPEVVVVHEVVPAGRHIRRTGENVTPGDLVLAAGQPMTPAAVSAAISVGHGTVRIRRRPRIAVLSTGSELVPPGQAPGPGQIPDSNSSLLAGLAVSFGAEVVMVGTVSDDPDEFRAALATAGRADLVVTSGGVSAGAFEVVRQVTSGEVSFGPVAMQPGKPQGVGTVQVGDPTRANLHRVPMLALPGNPVSVFVSAWLFVRPLIAALAGASDHWRSVTVPVGDQWRSPRGRRQYVPVRFEDGTARLTHRLGSGSHLVASLADAQGLAVVAAEIEQVREGDVLEVFLID